MRKSIRQGTRFGVIALVLMVSAAFVSADKMVGLDVNGNSACQQADFDMGQYWGSGTTGTEVTFDVFYQDIPSILIFGCVFCTTEKSRVTSESFVYNSPGVWTDNPLRDSEEQDFPIIPSPSITTTYPNYKCWMVQSTDFTFSTPFTAEPKVLGTFTYNTAAEETWIPWILDGPNCGYLTATTFISGTFSGAGEVCDHTYRTESSSWGSVKKMFR